MRALKYTGAAVAAVVLILALLLIVGIPSGFLTSTIQDRVERATGYRLTIAGATKISVWPTLNVTLSDLTLQDPKDRDGSKRVTVGSVQADMTLSSIWSGHPKVSELVITKPMLYVPLLRERNRTGSSRPAASSDDADAVAIDRVSIVDGGVTFSNVHDRVENRIDGVNAKATIDADHNLHLVGSAHAGDNPLSFDIKASLPAQPVEHQNIPVEISLDARNLLSAPLTAKADVRVNGSILMINGISGNIGDGGAFNGYASVDLDSKPLMKLDLDFQRLDLATPKASAGAASDAWSDAPIDLTWLNYHDAQVKISAAQVDIGTSQFAPVAVEATLAGGVMKTSVSNLGTYGGSANGELIVDASSGNPSYAMHCDIVGVRALPLLTSLANFDKIDGLMQAKIAARSTGASQHAIMSNMSGTVFATFQNGEIRGVNVAQMIRDLTASTLSGWQEQKSQGSGTDLTQLSASFKIDRGQAQTTDLNLVGPLVKVTGAGTIDLGTKMIGFRVEPKLVMTTEGQGRTTDPVGLGIPVMISGPWSAPKIYPDMAGILDNPDGAYAKLRQMGQGLFGSAGANLGNMNLGGLLGGLTGSGQSSGSGNNSGGAGSSGGGGSSDQLGGNLGQTLGNLIQQGLGGFGGNNSGGSTGGRAGSRSLVPQPQSQVQPQIQPEPAAPSAAPPPAASPSGQPASTQDSQPMNDVLRQLFNRSSAN